MDVFVKSPSNICVAVPLAFASHSHIVLSKVHNICVATNFSSKALTLVLSFILFDALIIRNRVFSNLRWCFFFVLLIFSLFLECMCLCISLFFFFSVELVEVVVI